MLRAEELMVGDWVYMKAHRGFDSQYIKVESIPDPSSDTLYGHIGAYPISEDMDFRDIEDSHLEPIPITQEILEKNGFTNYGESWFIPHDDKNKRESVMVGFHMYCTVINITKGNNAYYKEVPCKYRCCAENRHVYIHELQHCLKLCGIDKTIEL